MPVVPEFFRRLRTWPLTEPIRLREVPKWVVDISRGANLGGMVGFLRRQAQLRMERVSSGEEVYMGTRTNAQIDDELRSC